jgi:N-formylglutamate amidohydrolase
MTITPDFFGVPVSHVSEPPEMLFPVVFNSAHSGRYYPQIFAAQTRLDAKTLRKSEDCHVDGLFAPVVSHGMALHVANFPRAYVDVNREPYELDPRMFDGALPAHANIGSPRVAGGLGSVPRIVGEGVEIYGRRIPVEEGLQRIERVYKPYHRTLRSLLSRTHQQFGEVILLDCHSMPSSLKIGPQGFCPDIVLGNRFGASAAPDITDCAIDALQALGFSVVCNKPYAGGYITEHYGRPRHGFHALQIEINRALYMNEITLELTSGFASLQAALEQFALAFARQAGRLSYRYPLAAE